MPAVHAVRAVRIRETKQPDRRCCCRNGKGETAEGDVSVPVRRLLGRSRICCGLSHQWSAITGDTRSIEYTGMIP